MPVNDPVIARAMEHPDILGEGAKKRRMIKDPQKKVQTVLEEFKRGTLRSGSGQKVSNKEQAIAIALSEAGLTKNELSEDEGNELSSLIKDVLGDSENETVDIPNVVILGSGQFQGIGPNAKEPYTEKDLEEIAINHRLLEEQGKWIPRLSISHEEAKDTQGNLSKYLAFGMVQNIRVSGNKLLADFKNVPKRVANFIKDGLLPSRSSELWEKVKPEFLGLKTQDGQVLNNVIRRVSLLGHEPPAMWEIEGIVNKYELSKELNDIEIKIYKYSEGEESMSKSNSLPDNFIRNDCLTEIKKYMQEPDMKYMEGMFSLENMSDEELYQVKKKLHDEVHRRQHLEMGDPLPVENNQAKQPVQMMISDMEKMQMSKYEHEKPEQGNPPAVVDDKAIEAAIKKYQLEAEKKAEEKYAAKFAEQAKEMADMKVGLVKFQLEAQRLEHEKSVDTLIKQNKVAPSERESTLGFMARLAEIPEVKKYSLGDSEKEGTILSQYVDLLKSRTPNKAYSIEEQAPSYGGVKIDTSEFDKYKDLSGEVTTETLVEHQKIKKYMVDNNVTYEKAYDVITGTDPLGSLF